MSVFNKKLILFWQLIAFLLLSTTITAEMAQISDTELDAVTGQAFSNFEYTEYPRNGTTFIKMQITLDVDIAVRAKIDQLKLGNYYYGGTTGATLMGSNEFGINYPGDIGWNVDIEGLQIGKYSDARGGTNETFRMNNLIIRTDYEISGNDKILTTFAIGSDNCHGTVYADYFRSFSGAMSGELASNSGWLIDLLGPYLIDEWAFRTYLLNGVNYRGQSFNMGHDGMTWDGHGMYMVIDKEIGIGMYAGMPINDLLSHWVQ